MQPFIRKVMAVEKGYRFSIATVGIATGVIALCQLTAGGTYRSHPEASYWGFVVLNGVCLLAAACGRKSAFFRWFTGVPAFAGIAGCFLLLCLLAGIVPQERHYPLAEFSFFRHVTDSYLWGGAYLLVLLSLGATLVRRVFVPGKRKAWFFLVHAGVWLILFFAALNSLKSASYAMEVRKGQTEWRVYDAENRLLELPVAVQLDSVTASPAGTTVAHTTVYTADGQEKRLAIQANRPGRVGDWAIYPYQPVQKEREKSILVLACNPHWNGVRSGIALLAVGLFLLLYHLLKKKI